MLHRVLSTVRVLPMVLSWMNDVMRIVKEMQPRIVSQTYDNTCEIKLSIRKSEAEQLKNRLSKLSFE